MAYAQRSATGLGIVQTCKFACNTDPLEGGFRVQS